MLNEFKKPFCLFSLFYRDIVLALLITLVTFFSIFTLYGEHQDKLLTDGEDSYFQGDIPRNFNIMTNRTSFAHYRVKVHPLISLETYIPTFIIKKMGVSFPLAVKIVVCLIASFWSIFLYCLFRLIGNDFFQATLLTMLGLTSASAMFWLSIPESYALGSISIICALMFAAISNHRKLAEKYYVFLNVFTFGVTITNWMAGIAATLSSHNVKQTIKLCSISLLIVILLWGIQKQIFPQATFFIGSNEESQYMFYPDLVRIQSLFVNFFSHTVIAPEIQVSGYTIKNWAIVSFKNSSIASSNLLELSSSIIWFATLGISAIATYFVKGYKAIKFTIFATIAGQLLLHLFYGEELFLYSLHFLPLLLVIISLSLKTPASKVVLPLVAVMIPLFFMNNLDKFKKVCVLASPPIQQVTTGLTEIE